MGTRMLSFCYRIFSYTNKHCSSYLVEKSSDAVICRDEGSGSFVLAVCIEYILLFGMPESLSMYNRVAMIITLLVNW